MKVTASLELILIVALVIGLALWGAARRADAAEAALAAERTEHAATQAALLGYEVAFESVAQSVVAKDSIARALEEELRRAEARSTVRTVTRVETRVDTLIVGEEAAPNTWVGHLDVEPFTGEISFELPAAEFGLTLACTPRIEQYLVEGADGRWFVAARPLSPSTTLRVEALEVPQIVREDGGLAWYWLPIAFVGGAFSWEVAR